jgi:hypothetical protein
MATTLAEHLTQKRDYHADALKILNAKVFVKAPMPEIDSVVSDVELRAIDPHHVLPNMGVVTNSGVWFPLGY